MVRLFAQINRSAAPMLGLVALGLSAVGLAFVKAGTLAIWSTVIACAVALVYALPIAFLESVDAEASAGAWRRKFVLATAFCGSAWAYLAVALLRTGEPDAQAFAVLVMLLVSTIMSLVAAAIPAAYVAGMLPMIGGVVMLYAPRLQGAATAAVALTIGVIGYFLVVVQRLHASAARNISFQAEKDSLIAELEQARLNSDEARRRAESANLAKSRFLATMSHELRTPLNAILGFSEVMKGELFGPHGVPAYKEYATDIHASGQHLLMLINEILDLSRVEAGQYELKEKPVSLPALVEECCRLLSMRAKSRNLTLTDALDRDLPRIWADERALLQVDAEPLDQCDQVHAPGRLDRRQGRLDQRRRPVRLDQGHRPRHPGRRDPDRSLLVRPRLARAEECGRGNGAGPADRQGPRRTAWRTVSSEFEASSGHGSGRHLAARTNVGLAARESPGGSRPARHEARPQSAGGVSYGTAFSPKPAASTARCALF